MSQNINVSTEMAQNSPLEGSRCTVRDLLELGESLFTGSELYFGHGTDSAWDEAVCLLLFALGLDTDTDRSVLDKKLTDIEQRDIKSLFNRRIQERVPAPYITGQAWFCGLPFIVDERVIIPRSPIAELIMNYFEPWLLKIPQRILDLCTGGGCIGISCAYGFDEADVVLSDISEEALAVADLNISKHELGQRVSSVHSDLFSALLGQTFDLIVSNPPYVDAEDLASMPEEFHHEPELALASGADGLDFTRRLLREASDYLSSEGILVVEVGNSSVALQDAFPLVPFLWFEFAEGDGGVFMLTRSQLVEHRELFQ